MNKLDAVVAKAKTLVEEHAEEQALHALEGLLGTLDMNSNDAWEAVAQVAAFCVKKAAQYCEAGDYQLALNTLSKGSSLTSSKRNSLWKIKVDWKLLRIQLLAWYSIVHRR